MVFSFLNKEDKSVAGAKEKRERANQMRRGERQVEGAFLDRRDRTGKMLATMLVIILALSVSYMLPESVMSKLNVTGVDMIDNFLTKRHGVDFSGILIVDNFLSHVIRALFFMLFAGLIPFITHLISFLLDKKNTNFYLLNWVTILLIINAILLYGGYQDLYAFMSK